MTSTNILYDYTFEQGRIFELQFNDAIHLKSDKYKWYLIYDGYRYGLKLITLKEGQFVLKYGETMDIMIDVNYSYLEINKTTYKLTNNLS